MITRAAEKMLAQVFPCELGLRLVNLRRAVTSNKAEAYSDATVCVRQRGFAD